MSENNINEVMEKNIVSKCPNCGSELAFLPGTNKNKCVSCGSTFDIESIGKGKLDSEEVDFISALEKVKSISTEKTIQRTIHCEDCGALITLNNKTVSTSCPFCGSNRTIEESKTEDTLKINGVIPFALNDSDIKTLFKNWIRKKALAPTKFKKGKISPEFRAFYIPFYTFDSKTNSSYTAKRGDYYTVTRTVRTKNGTRLVTERRIRWTSVSGRVNRNFDDILVRGTSNILNQYIDQIKNYDFTSMEKYQEKFLLGYYAERPALNIEQGFSSAKQAMMSEIRRIAKKQIGGDVVENLKVKTAFDDVTFKEIMAPIYNGSYVFKNKKYKFVVNGQTGKFAGAAPVSVLKVLLIIFVVLAVITIILCLNLFLGNSETIMPFISMIG